MILLIARFRLNKINNQLNDLDGEISTRVIKRVSTHFIFGHVAALRW